VLQGIRDSSSKSDLILIHDGVRPFINARLLTSVIKAAHKAGAAVLGIPVKSTIKRADRNGFVETTLDRHRLWEIQTPQVFAKKLILTAFKKFGEIMATDDSMLVERLGKKIKIISGSYDNIKITTPEDMYVAEGIVKRCRCA
jgi:2-C-methyl-D-erythritol 4-phosphate cytidylyltransferase